MGKKHQNPGKPVTQQHEAEKTNPHTEGPPAVVPPSPGPSENASDKGQDNTPRWKKTLEFVAAVIGLGLLIVNYFQLRSTQKAADAATFSAKNAVIAIEAEQRPWLLPRFTVRDSLKLEGTTVKIVVIPHVSNTGHSPAILVRHVAELFMGPIGPGKTESDQEQTARINSIQKSECATAANPVNPFTVFPGEEHESVPMVLSYDLSPYRSGGPHFFQFYISMCVDYVIPISQRHVQVTYVGMVNGNPDPIPVTAVDARGNFTLTDAAQRHEIVTLFSNAY